MRFLIDANLPHSVVELCRERGIEALHVDQLMASGTADAQVAELAIAHGLCLVTRDYDFADVRAYPPAQFAGIIVLELPHTATATSIRQLMAALLDQESILENIAGKLAIVEFGRVRIRTG